jgi:hypothetical protein
MSKSEQIISFSNNVKLKVTTSTDPEQPFARIVAQEPNIGETQSGSTCCSCMAICVCVGQWKPTKIGATPGL